MTAECGANRIIGSRRRLPRRGQRETIMRVPVAPAAWSCLLCDGLTCCRRRRRFCMANRDRKVGGGWCDAIRIVRA